MMTPTSRTVVKKVLHMFSAVGGGAKGFKRARVDVAGMQGQWQCLGGIDVDERANVVFRQRVDAPATTMDLADASQYRAIHNAEPPEGWRPATPDDIRRAAQHQRPDCIFLSAPCKGFSGLLSEAKSTTAKYQAMNGLAERGLWLALEAWADDPVPIILFENVPRLLTRGRAFVDQLIGMLHAYGYATAETVHDCGELGKLGQSRKRCLIVARHMAKVPNFLYEPQRHPLRAVGDVIGRLWLPGDAAAGPMHRVPRLQWKTWVRLAFVTAGSDWRSLNQLAVEDGHLRDYLLVPEMHNGGYGVRTWGEPSGVIASHSGPSNGAFSVADPRFQQSAQWSDGQAYGVRPWDTPTGTIPGQAGPGQGAYAVADPRHEGPPKHSNEYRIVRWERSSCAVTGAHGSGQCVADPRGGTDPAQLHGKYPVCGWDHTARTVIAGEANGAYAVADPRTGMAGDRTAYLTGGHYGVLPWDQPAGAVSAAACHDNGRWSVADPRLPAADEKTVARIRALDGTWHRPFTTLELAALQSLFDPEDPADAAAFAGALFDASASDSIHREFIGNAVPPDAGEAVAAEILRTLMLADAGETFQLSAAPVWVRPIAAAMNLARGASE